MIKIISLTLILVSLPSYAFRLNTNTGASFNDKEVKIYITSNSTCTNAGISKEDLLDIAVSGAKKFWNKVPTSNLRLKRGGIYNTSDTKFLTEKLCAKDDETTCPTATSVPTVNDIVIACNNDTTDNFPSNVFLAISAPTKVSGKSIKGSVVLINDTATSTFGNLSRSEMESVLAHEIGHAVGLGHSNKDEALMYYENSDSMKRLSQDDINGITYLYPNKMNGCAPLAGLFGGTMVLKTNNKTQSNNKFNFPLSLLFGFIMSLLVIFIVRNLFLSSHTLLRILQAKLFPVQ